MIKIRMIMTILFMMIKIRMIMTILFMMIKIRMMMTMMLCRLRSPGRTTRVKQSFFRMGSRFRYR